MAKRYFENAFSDSQEIANTSHDFWKDKVYSLIKCLGHYDWSSPDRELYTGTSGIVYMLYRLAISDEFKNNSELYLNKAVKVLEEINKLDDKTYHCKFICGKAGTDAVNAAIYHLMCNENKAEEYLEMFRGGAAICKPIEYHKMYGGDELFVGRTGYLFGVLWLESVFGRKIIPNQDIIDICSTIVESGRKYSEVNESIFPLMYAYYSTEYLGKFFLYTKNVFYGVFHRFLLFLGAAHGLSTILQVLISFPQFIEKEQKARQDIKKCIDILVSFQTTNGNFPCSMDELGSDQRPEDDELVHWCHGAPGNHYLLHIIILICTIIFLRYLRYLFNYRFCNKKTNNIFFRCCIFISQSIFGF